MATIRFFIRAGKTEERDVSVWANVFISKSEKGRRIQFQINTDIKGFPLKGGTRLPGA